MLVDHRRLGFWNALGKNDSLFARRAHTSSSKRVSRLGTGDENSEEKKKGSLKETLEGAQDEPFKGPYDGPCGAQPFCFLWLDQAGLEQTFAGPQEEPFQSTL